VIVSVKVFGARELAARWLAHAATIDTKIEVGLEKNAQLLLQGVQQRAPVDTGQYRASFHIERERNGRAVFTGEPYGRRLEYGFVGMDSLGRVYSQAPRPHVNPAADAVEGPFVEDMTDVAVRGL
jgi:hypothetical protein